MLMSKQAPTLYKNNLQRLSVIDGVDALMIISRKHGCTLSKETLKLICDKYADLFDSPEGPLAPDNRYGAE